MLNSYVGNRECFFIKLFLIFLFFTFFIDGVSKYTRIYYGFIISTPFRFFVLLVCVFFLFYSQSLFSKAKQKIFLLFLFSISIVIGSLLSGIWVNTSYLDLVYLTVRYMSGLVFIIAASSVTLVTGFSRKFHFIFLINVVISLLGYIFDIRVFRTYGHIESVAEGWIDDRFGFNGLLLEQNISSYFYAIGAVNSYFLYKRKDINILWLLLSFASCLLVGTKTLIIFVSLFILSIIIKNRIHRSVVIGAFSLGVLLFIFSNPHLLNFINYDLFNVVSSFRLENIYSRLYPKLSGLGWSEYMFGIQGAYYKDYLVEFEFIDLLVFSGVIGSLIYLLVFFHSTSSFFKVKNGKTILFLFMLVAAFSGHLFYDPTAMFYFSVLILIVNEHVNINTKCTFPSC